VRRLYPFPLLDGNLRKPEISVVFGSDWRIIPELGSLRRRNQEVGLANQINILTFLLPGIAGAMAHMFETAGWDGVYFDDTQNLAGDVFRWGSPQPQPKT